jgi:hypothetical protein
MPSRRVGAEQDARRLLGRVLVEGHLLAPVLPGDASEGRDALVSAVGVANSEGNISRSTASPGPIFYDEAMDTASVPAAGRNAARKSTTAA